MEHLEVMPISSRVVCLNAPYLKSLSIFEALSRTLGCYYNHHRPQVVSCQASVRLPAPRIVKVRGHASHAHTPCDTPTVQTIIKMGTYLVFYLKDWSEIHKCHLILNGIEKVSKAKAPVPPKIFLERIIDTAVIPPIGTTDQGEEKSTESIHKTQCTTQVHETLFSQKSNQVAILKETTFSQNNNNVSVSRIKEALFSNARTSDKVHNANTLPKPQHLQSIPVRDNSYSSVIMHSHNGKSCTPDNDPSKLEEINIKSEPTKEKREKKNTNTIISLNMDQSEEITTLLDDDNDDDSEYTSDTSDDLHKVVRKRLSVDITSLIHTCPKNNILVLLMKPAEETQAWQFLSSCMKVTHYSKKSLVPEGSGTIKKALTRTRPLYFSKNGNAQRL